MAVAYSGSGTAGDGSNSYTTSAALTTYTANTGTTVLYAGLSLAIAYNSPITSPTMTWNSVSMTPLGTWRYTDTNGKLLMFFLYSLVKPDSGNRTLQATWSPTVAYSISAAAFSGTDKYYTPNVIPNTKINSRLSLGGAISPPSSGTINSDPNGATIAFATAYDSVLANGNFTTTETQTNIYRSSLIGWETPISTTYAIGGISNSHDFTLNAGTTRWGVFSFTIKPYSPMKIYSDNSVQITDLVEIQNASPKLYANGTYVCSQFIESEPAVIGNYTKIDSNGVYGGSVAGLITPGITTKTQGSSFIIFASNRQYTEVPNYIVTDNYNNVYSYVGNGYDGVDGEIVLCFISINAKGGTNHSATVNTTIGLETGTAHFIEILSNILVDNVTGTYYYTSTTFDSANIESGYATTTMNNYSSLLLTAFETGFGNTAPTSTNDGSTIFNGNKMAYKFVSGKAPFAAKNPVFVTPTPTRAAQFNLGLNLLPRK